MKFITEKEIITLVKQFHADNFLTIEQKTYRRLLEVSGENNFNLVNILVLMLEEAYESTGDYKSIKAENEALRLKVSQLQKELDISNKALSHFNQHYVQRELVQNGKKLAYKKKVDALAVKELLDKGYSIAKTAETLGVSRGLIYRRIEELEKAKEI